jgi:hypothetical protein
MEAAALGELQVSMANEMEKRNPAIPSGASLLNVLI